MKFTRRYLATAALALSCLLGPIALSAAKADSREEATAKANDALQQLEAKDSRAVSLARRAKAVLVFPSVLKAGFVFGGETGNGVLLVHGQPEGFYNLSGGSWGLQIGGQDFAYAMFFMTDSSLDYLRHTDGFAVGTGPSIVIINQGAAGVADTTTLANDVYAFPFNQKGLMADLTLQGTKITRIHHP